MVRFENTRCRHREFLIVIMVWLVDNAEPLDWFENQLENEVCLPENYRHCGLIVTFQAQ